MGGLGSRNNGVGSGLPTLAAGEEPVPKRIRLSGPQVYCLVASDEETGNKIWVNVANVPRQACALSGLKLSPNNDLRRIVNDKVYNHEEVRKHIIVLKNKDLIQEFRGRLELLVAKKELDQQETNELFYLNQFKEYLFNTKK